MIDGKYWVSDPFNRGMSTNLPGSHHIMIDYGCLIVFDEDNEILCAYAQGQWAQVTRDGMYETEGDD